MSSYGIRRLVRGALCACLVIAFVTPGYATGPSAAPSSTARLDIQPAPPGRLPWVVFDERAGLPQHTIVDMLVDTRGFVWAATQDGAARFNGHRWETVALPRSMGSNYARCMRAAADGGIWIGSFDGGVAHLHDGVWKVIDMKSGLPSNRIRGLLENSDKRGTVLWVATDAGVARVQDGRIDSFGETEGLPSLDTEGLYETTGENGERTLLVGTSQGLARFAGNRFEAMPVPRQLLGHRIEDILESPGLGGDMALWIDSYGGGMAVLEHGAWKVLDTTSGLPSNVEVITKSRAADGSPALWIGTEGGLLRFEHGRFTLYDERSGLPIRIIWKVVETTSPGGLNSLWLGTWGGGVVRLSPNMWTAFDSTTGVPAGAVTSLLLSKDDSGADEIWAGTSDGELARFSGDRFTSIPIPEPLRHAIIFSLMETHKPDGTRVLWVASFGGGIGKLENGHWTILDRATLPQERIYHLLETKADDATTTLWVATEGGLGRFEHEHWTYYRKELPSEDVVHLLATVDAAGTPVLFVATSRGIGQFKRGQWTSIGKQDGLGGENISGLVETRDASGARWLWAGTYSGGVSRLRLDDPAARWQSWSSDNLPGLPSSSVMNIAQDGDGRVYLCTTRGLARLTPHGSDAGSFTTELFTTEDGLPSSDCQPRAAVVDPHGRIWMGTARGIAMFDPRTERPDSIAKPLWIDRAGLSDGSLLLHGGETLSHAQRNLTFSASLLAYGAESRIRYRYQLAGFDPEPSEWTASSEKEYTNLGAGSYNFQLWGMDARGNVSGPVGLPFTVLPAPWLTIWAFLAYAALIVLIAYGIMRLRLRALAMRTRQLESEVAVRTSELVLARDELARLATEDALTGVANRRKFDTVLDQEWRRAQRDGHWLTLVLLDVDFFKRYNDRYGHAHGDACLRAVAQAIAAQGNRPSDLVARYGGEEFTMILPETDPDGIPAVLRAVLAAVDALRIEHADSACAAHVTVSLGAVSIRPGVADNAHAALRRADELLYQAKQHGRHQAVYAGAKDAVSAIAPAAQEEQTPGRKAVPA